MRIAVDKVIANIETQVGGMRRDQYDDASWNYEEGVLLSAREARALVAEIRRLRRKKAPDAHP